MSVVELAVEKYKKGEHVHLGHPNDCQKDPEELEKQRMVERAIIDAIYKYELERGGIRMVNGLFEYDPEVLSKLPQYRNNENLWCCIENEKDE